MGFCTQYKALLKKNFILKRRTLVSTIFELALPAVVFLVLVIVKELLPPKHYPPSLQLDQQINFGQTERVEAVSALLAANNAKIAFYPPAQSAPIRQYMVNMGFDEDEMVVFADAKALKDYIGTSKYAAGLDDSPVNIHCAIEVGNLDGPAYQYALRFNATDSNNSRGTLDPDAYAVTNMFQRAYETSWNVFDRQGFMLMQDLIDTYILTKEGVYTWPGGDTTDIHDDQLKRNFLPFPTQKYTVDDFANTVGSSLGFILTLIFVWPLTRIISALVEEKELKLKASMQLMGLATAPFFLSWLTTYTIFFALISLLLCLASFWGVYSNSFIIFIFLVYFFFGMTVFAVAYLISAFFDNAKIASAFGSIIFLLTFFVSFASDSASPGAKTLMCLIPTVCLSQTGSLIADLEGLGVGVTTTTVREEMKNFKVSTGIWMLLVDIGLYLVLGMYFHQVTRSHFGISKPWYFIFQRSFWFGTPYSRRSAPFGMCCPEAPSDRHLPPFDPLNSNEPQTQVEPPLQDDDPIIQVRELRKTFPGTSGSSAKKKGGFSCFGRSFFSCFSGYEDFVAVKGASLDMYAGQIFVLLGENGAGKSTLFNMLTGLVPPTSGEALLNGYSVTKDIDQIYAQQGVCFQHDVLYPLLTVKEHMYLFAAVKQMDMSNVEDEIMSLLNTVGLGPTGDNKVNALSSTLSGGQKRKLSVAISLLNDPKVLFLDELSTGVDVNSVRALWRVLLEARKGRVIVMTTHDMDEASSIADRIGIIAAGKVMCSGSNLFLKEQYGVGYTLTINKMAVDTDTGTDPNSLDFNDIESAMPSSGAGAPRSLVPVSVSAPVSGAPVDDYYTPFDGDARPSSLQLAQITPPVSPAGVGAVSGGQLVGLPKDGVLAVSTRSGKKIRDYVVNHFPFAILASDSAGEIVFKLPLSCAPDFPNMLDALNNDHESLGISTYALGVTSLTEVFLKVIKGQSREDLHQQQEDEERENGNGNGNDHDDDNGHNAQFLNDNGRSPRSGGSAGPHPHGEHIKKKHLVDDTWGSVANNITELSGTTIFTRHFKALFVKRFNNFKRDGRAALWTLLYPGIILLAGLLSLKYGVDLEMPRREMTASLYSKFTPQLILGNPTATDSGIVAIHDALGTIAPTYTQDITPVTTTDATITGMQQWLQDEYNLRRFNEGRFGGFLVTEASNIPATNPALPPTLSFSLHVNNTAPDSLPVFSNYMNNAILNSAKPGATISMYNAPLPLTKRFVTFISSTTAFIIAIAMSFVPASYAAYVVRERQDQVKHLQMVSGVSNLAYWLSNMAWDVANFILPFGMIVIILFAFDIEPFMEASGAILVVVSLWFFVIAACPFTYAISFLFDSHTTAQNMILLINFLSSVVLLVLSFLLTIIDSTRSVNKVLRFFFRLLPGYCLGDCFMQILIRKNIYPLSKSAWELEIAGWNLIFFVFDAIIYTGLIILFEHWSSNNTWEWIRGGCTSISAADDAKFFDPEEDSDVAALRQRIESGGSDDSEKFPVVLKGLRKVYPTKGGGEPFMAVSNVFLEVKKGSTLGFLGANGAGKTTTMKMLTSDIYPSEGSGDAVLGGYSLLHQSEKIRHLLGYCPQFDALIPLLTAREHLTLYASIKCVPAEKIAGYVNFMLQKLGLNHLADRMAGTYSGGNKRKLSLGISIIGNPLILLLDEVSSGVDPSSRRTLWQLISSTTGSAKILVSHSIEEIESLSNQIAIFASGRVRAYGTSLHLKQRHGNGLQIELQCTGGKQDDVHQWFANQYPTDLSVVEQHRVTLKYAIPKEHYNMTDVFRTMEQAKQNGIGIESYSVSETSLDQIFINFIRQDDVRRNKHDGQRT